MQRDARWFVGLVVAAVMVRGVTAGWMHFGTDEAYAVAVALPLQASYFDHPPAVFWLAGAMETLMGSRDPIWLRLPFLVCGTGVLVAMYALGNHLFGRPAGLFAGVTIAASGVLGITSATWILPDGPLLVMLSIGSWGAAKALFPSPDGLRSPAPVIWWIVAGAAAAGAALAKYHAIFFPLGLIAFLVTSREHRPLLRTAGPWLAAGIACIGAIPVVWWNAMHDWASFRFQVGRSAASAAWSLAPFAENVAGQFGYLLPWVAPVMVWGVLGALRGTAPQSGSDVRARRRFVLCLALGPILVFTLITLGGSRGLPHWQAPGWCFAALLAGERLANRHRAGAHWPQRWGMSALAATWTLALALIAGVNLGWADRGMNTDPAVEALGWDPIAAAALQMRDSLGVDSIAFAATVHWMQAAKLGAAMGNQLPVLVLAHDARHFAFKSPTSDWRGQDGILLRAARRDARPLEDEFRERFTSIERLPDVTIRRHGRPVWEVERYRVRGLDAVAENAVPVSPDAR